MRYLVRRRAANDRGVIYLKKRSPSRDWNQHLAGMKGREGSYSCHLWAREWRTGNFDLLLDFVEGSGIGRWAKKKKMRVESSVVILGYPAFPLLQRSYRYVRRVSAWRASCKYCTWWKFGAMRFSELYLLTCLLTCLTAALSFDAHPTCYSADLPRLGRTPELGISWSSELVSTKHWRCGSEHGGTSLQYGAWKHEGGDYTCPYVLVRYLEKIMVNKQQGRPFTIVLVKSLVPKIINRY